MRTRREALRGGAQAGLAALLAGTAGRQAGAAAPEDPWPALAQQVFEGRPVADGAEVVALEAPTRAEDAALVPIRLRTLLPADDPRRVLRLTLLIDANPSPLAAIFELGPESGIDAIATRVRVNDYTNIHAVAELADGRLYGVARFVKAAGGCSAPAQTATASDIPLGTMRWRMLPLGPGDAASGKREAALMIRHPNASGMQMDQLTRLYIPAHFVQLLRIWQGDAPLLAMQGGISLAENPELRLHFRPTGRPLRAEAKDNQGGTFRAEWPAAAV